MFWSVGRADGRRIFFFFFRYFVGANLMTIMVNGSCWFIYLWMCYFLFLWGIGIGSHLITKKKSGLNINQYSRSTGCTCWVSIFLNLWLEIVSKNRKNSFATSSEASSKYHTEFISTQSPLLSTNELGPLLRKKWVKSNFWLYRLFQIGFFFFNYLGHHKNGLISFLQ